VSQFGFDSSLAVVVVCRLADCRRIYSHNVASGSVILSWDFTNLRVSTRFPQVYSLWLEQASHILNVSLERVLKSQLFEEFEALEKIIVKT